MKQSIQKVDQSFLDQFNSIQKSGVLDDLATLRTENRFLDTLVNDAAKLYALTSVADIMTFVTDRILQQFIPMYFLVAFEPPRSKDLQQYCYANLKPSNGNISYGAFNAIKRCFVDSPYPARIDELLLGTALKIELSHFDPWLIVPLCGLEGIYGLCIIGKKVVGDAYSSAELMYIDKFTRFISIAIQNNLNYECAITDSKTGLYNHGYFMQRLEQEIAHVSRYDAKAGLIMLDIDHFKRFNDTWGHLAGDEVLNVLSATLKRTVRIEDVASRFGGEEFCVLAIECDERKLQDMSERIRLAIEAMNVSYDDTELKVTVSLGCCCLDPGLHVSPNAYIEMADKALYLSKSEGRNRFTIYRRT